MIDCNVTAVRYVLLIKKLTYPAFASTDVIHLFFWILIVISWANSLGVFFKTGVRGKHGNAKSPIPSGGISTLISPFHWYFLSIFWSSSFYIDQEDTWCSEEFTIALKGFVLWIFEFPWIFMEKLFLFFLIKDLLHYHFSICL